MKRKDLFEFFAALAGLIIAFALLTGFFIGIGDHLATAIWDIFL